MGEISDARTDPPIINSSEGNEPSGSQGDGSRQQSIAGSRYYVQAAVVLATALCISLLIQLTPHTVPSSPPRNHWRKERVPGPAPSTRQQVIAHEHGTSEGRPSTPWHTGDAATSVVAAQPNAMRRVLNRTPRLSVSASTLAAVPKSSDPVAPRAAESASELALSSADTKLEGYTPKSFPIWAFVRNAAGGSGTAQPKSTAIGRRRSMFENFWPAVKSRFSIARNVLAALIMAVIHTLKAAVRND